MLRESYGTTLSAVIVTSSVHTFLVFSLRSLFLSFIKTSLSLSRPQGQAELGLWGETGFRASKQAFEAERLRRGRPVGMGQKGLKVWGSQVLQLGTRKVNMSHEPLFSLRKGYANSMQTG